MFKSSLSELIFALCGKCCLPFAHPSWQDGCNSSSPQSARVSVAATSPALAGTAVPLTVFSQLTSPSTCFEGALVFSAQSTGNGNKKKEGGGGLLEGIKCSFFLQFFPPLSKMLEGGGFFFEIPDLQHLHQDELCFTDSGYRQPIVVQLIFPLEIPCKYLNVL